MPETLTAGEHALLGRTELRTARIVGLGHKLPERIVGNAEIAERIGVDSDWIVRRTGIRQRRYAARRRAHRPTSRSPPPAAR